MRKSMYRSVDVKEIRISALVERLAEGPVWVGLDVGKREVLAVLRDSSGTFLRPWRIRQPQQIRLFVAQLDELRSHRAVSLAMESTGTYGDALRQAVTDAGFEIRRVNAKATQDYAEIFDGVPSAHDGKDAGIIAELAALGKSQPWACESTPEEQARMDLHVEWLTGQQEVIQIWQGKLEAQLARHWPELTSILDFSSATLLRLLAHYGDPAQLAADEEAANRLAKWGRAYLKAKKIERVIQSAQTTVGVRMNAAQAELVRRIAQQILDGRAEMRRSREQLGRLVQENTVLQRMATVVGVVTACVLYSTLGDPRDYHCGAAYRKGMGLNLKERSSGQYQGKLRITKRGPSQARQWLFFAALRLIQEPSIRGWYEGKKARDQGRGLGAVVGVMRKLALAIYSVTVHEEEFCASRLFPGRGKERPRTLQGALPPDPRDLAPGSQSRKVLKKETAKG